MLPALYKRPKIKVLLTSRLKVPRAGEQSRPNRFNLRVQKQPPARFLRRETTASLKKRENPEKDLLSVIAERRFPCQKRADPEKGHPYFLNPLRHADQIGTGNLDALATSGNALANGVQLLRELGNIPRHIDEIFPRGNFIPMFIIHKTYVWNQSVPRTLFRFSYICFSISTLF